VSTSQPQGKQRGCSPITCGCAVLLSIPVLIYGLIMIVGTPDGGAALRYTRAITCQSKMRQCALALMMYCDDWNDTLPSSALVNHTPKWNKKDFIAFAGQRGLLPPVGRPRTLYQILAGPLESKYPSHGDSSNDAVDILLCHDDTCYGMRKTLPTDPPSYCYRIALDKAWYGVGCAKPFRTMDDFPDPAKCIVLYERGPWHPTGGLAWNGQDRSKGLANGLFINVAYMDGHVSFVRIRNSTSGNPNNCIAADDGEPMYFNFYNRKPQNGSNPSATDVPAKFVDPGRFSDSLERFEVGQWGLRRLK
jgi:prepilin-type processing-associated H-X9-DG protein